MSFLAPWFLLGGLAIAGPIIFHLIHRAARERMPFSSLMFLRPTPPRMTRRRKLEHLWLLLLRCLCLLLLATGFARPFLVKHPAEPAPASEGRQLVLLLDTSASMRRAGLWDKARAIAQKYLDATSLADRVALMTFDRQPRTLVSFSQWSSWSVDQRPALARQQLSAATPGWMGTQLGLALTAAAEQLLDESSSGIPATRRELVVITDLQEGARLDGLQGHDWPTGVKVIVEQVESAHGNAGLAMLRETAGTRVDPTAPQVRISNSRDSNREKFQLGWVAMAALVLPARRARFTCHQDRRAPSPRPRSPPQRRSFDSTGDEEDFDNTAWYIRPEMDRFQIVYAGSESPNDPATLRYYLQRVFPETPRRKVEFTTPGQDSRIAPEALKSAGLIVVPGLLPNEESAAVRNAMVAGKTVLLVLTGTSMAPTLAALCGVPDVQLTEGTGNYALLGDIDFRHPLFAPFADPRFSDFAQIHFWKHRRWEIPIEHPGADPGEVRRRIGCAGTSPGRQRPVARSHGGLASGGQPVGRGQQVPAAHAKPDRMERVRRSRKLPVHDRRFHSVAGHRGRCRGAMAQTGRNHRVGGGGNGVRGNT